MKELTLEYLKNYGWKPSAKTIMYWFKINGIFYSPGGRAKFSEIIMRFDPPSKEMHIEAFFGGQSEGKLFEGIVGTEVEFISLMAMLRLDTQMKNAE